MIIHVRAMNRFNLFIHCLAASVGVAIAVWATLGAPPHQASKARFDVASRR
jgi:hypothetical protein